MNRRAPHTGNARPLVPRRVETVMTPGRLYCHPVVDDDDDLRQGVMDSLQGNQSWVLGARNREEALGLVSAHGPIMSLLLTEVVLPGMDGLALAARARDVTPDLPVLYLADNDQRSEAVRQGVADPRNSRLMKLFERVPAREGASGVEGLNVFPVRNSRRCVKSRAGRAYASSVDDAPPPHRPRRDWCPTPAC